MLQADKQPQRKQSMRKWSNVVTGSVHKPLAKTTSAPPTADQCQGSFKTSVSSTQPEGSNSIKSPLNRADVSAPKAPLHGILKQQAISLTLPPGDCLRFVLLLSNTNPKVPMSLLHQKLFLDAFKRILECLLCFSRVCLCFYLLTERLPRRLQQHHVRHPLTVWQPCQIDGQDFLPFSPSRCSNTGQQQAILQISD